MDTTPIPFLIAAAAIIWAIALIVLWRAIDRAPEVSSNEALSADDLWAEYALAEYTAENR